MKFVCTVVIDAPREKVVSIFQDVTTFKEWQSGFESFEQLSGTPGTPGAKAKIVFRTKKHVIELTETITVNNLPDEKSAFYEHVHMDNTMRNRFTSLGPGQTRYEAEIEYTRFGGFVPKLMAILAPGMFRKQVQGQLERFKKFAESKR